MGLLALSVAVLQSAAQAREDARADLGKLLLALVILSIYLDFMQLLIVWQSDLRRKPPWYLAALPRRMGHVVGRPSRWVISCCRSLCCCRRACSGRVGSSWASPRCWSLMEVLRAWWTVLPSLGRGIGWVDIACMVGVRGLALGFAPWAARARRSPGGARHV